MTENKSSKWPEWDSNPAPPDCESDALTTWPRCLPSFLWVSIKLCANRHNNSQNCWANNVCSGVKTDAINNSQQCWNLQCIVGMIQPMRLWRSCVMCRHGTNNVARAVQMDPTLLYYASAITEQKKCWELLAQSLTSFKLCATTCNKMCKQTEHVPFNNVGSCWSTMLHAFAHVGLYMWIQKFDNSPFLC